MTTTDHIGSDLTAQTGDGNATVNSGRVAGLKKRLIRLRRRDAPDGKRRFMPGSWVDGVVGPHVTAAPRCPVAATDPVRPGPLMPPWAGALDRWVNEGGGGDDPDETVWHAQTPQPNQPPNRPATGPATGPARRATG